MGFKFIFSIVLMIIHVLSIQGDLSKDKMISPRKGLNLQISSNDDTCTYLKDRLTVTLRLRNNDLIPVWVNRDMPVILDQVHRNTGERIVVRILNDSLLYVPTYLPGRDVVWRKRGLLTKVNTLVKKTTIRFRHIANEEMLHIRSSFTEMVDNRNFGTYTLQAFYINNFNDTIFSNTIQIKYLEEFVDQ